MLYRTGNIQVQQLFIDLLTNSENIKFANMDRQVGERAGDLRARYNLQLPDALQIATAIASGCEAFLTNDVQLQRVTDLSVLMVRELEL